jgi:predicted PurR-regulated permease PerM
MTERGSLDTLLGKALLLATALWLLYSSLGFVVDALIALTLAAAVLPLADAGQRRRVPRLVTVGGVYVLGLGGLAVLVTLLVPVILGQGQQLAERLPGYRDQAVALLEAARQRTGLWRGRPIRVPEIGLDEIGPVLRELVARSYLVTRGIFSVTLSALLVLFVAAYVVVDRRRIAEGLLAFVPPARRAETARVAGVVLERMGGYLRGQLAVSLCIAVLLSVGLSILGLDTPILIGVTAGALNFVPFLGSTIALLLALLVALNASPLTVVGVLGIFGGVQFLEGKVLVPYLLGRKVELHPLAVLAALVIGAQIAGLVGAVVAVPVAAGANAVAQEVYVKRLRR